MSDSRDSVEFGFLGTVESWTVAESKQDTENVREHDILRAHLGVSPIKEVHCMRRQCSLQLRVSLTMVMSRASLTMLSSKVTCRACPCEHGTARQDVLTVPGMFCHRTSAMQHTDIENF